VSDDDGELIDGRFKLLRKVGAGGMGDVWAARDVKADVLVALKVLRPERQVDEHIAARFRHEAQIGAMLKHPNITRVYEFVELDDGTLVLVMELLVGDALRTYLRTRGPISSSEAVAIFLPVLAGLQHAHDHNVVHRDLKPANIFLHVDRSGKVTPKILDFGIAKSQDSSVLTSTGDALGTPCFMSPEQVRAQPLDGRSDLFAVGTVLYEAIAGQNPFQAASPSAVLAQVLELEVDPDPRIEPRVWIELSRVLSKQPYERHASADELAKALTTALGETPEALSRFLRREPPPMPEADQGATVHDALPGMKLPAGTEDGPTRRLSLLRGARLRILLAVAAALACVGLVVLVGSLLRGRAETAAAAAAASSSAALSSAMAEDDTPPVEIELPAPSASAGDDEARPHAKAPTPAHRPRPRPAPSVPTRALGRTPGF
jgi:serine/threonine-protein kinase